MSDRLDVTYGGTGGGAVLREEGPHSTLAGIWYLSTRQASILCITSSHKRLPSLPESEKVFS